MKALIVEDDLQTLEAISLIFKLRWPEAELLPATSGSEVLTMVRKESPDLVILDLGLPDVDGIEVLKEIRAVSRVPVVIVTARGDSLSQIKGFELGANDYITKPFDAGVLLARIKNVLTTGLIPDNQVTAPLQAGSFFIDFDNYQISFRGKLLKLTPVQYRLLCYLVRNAGRVLSHENISKAVWGRGHESTGILRTYAYQLRCKLVEAGADSEIISSERGIGYKFVIPH